MTYTIYSIGDAAFLTAVLQSLAMVSGTGDFKMAAGIGALIGVLFMMVRGLMQSEGRGPGYQNMITALLLYLALFVPKAQVAIEDAYTGEMRLVDQVPLGPAVSGAILSTLGYRLTVLFEQGFSTPRMTQQGFAATLEIITAVRRNLKSRMDLGGANSPKPGTDLEETLAEYVRDCTLTGVDLGLTPIDQLLRTPKVLDAIRFDSDLYTTALHLNKRQEIVTCSAAWPLIEAYLNQEGLNALEKHLDASLGKTHPTMDRLQTALDALTGGQLAARDYMISAALLPMFEAGVIRRHEDSLHATRAAMVETAILQRNTQWAAEETLFSRIVRPMMAWIEGFSFAITPIMTFTLLLGGRGIQMMGQYFLMLVWIQLWMPILAIINLYITLSATNSMDALQRAAFELPSIMGLYQLDRTLENWLAVGGMLASSTPAIALMLVYGGSITATHFLGRMQSGDFIDEKVGAPSVITPSGLINMSPGFQHNPQTGVLGAGASAVLPNFEISQDHGQSIQSADAAAERSSRHFMQQVQQQVSLSQGRREEGFESEAISKGISTSQSATDRFIAQTGETYAERYRETGMSGDDYAALVGAAAHGSLRGGEGGLSLQSGLSGQLQNRFHVETSKADDIATDISSKVGSDRDWQTHFAESISKDIQQGVREVVSLGVDHDALNSLGSSATDVVETQRTYAKTLSESERHGTRIAIGAGEIGHRLASNPDSMAALDKALGTLGLRGEAAQLGAEWQQQRLINDDKESYAAAGLSLLSGFSTPFHHPLDEEQQQLGKHLGHIIMGNTFRAPIDSGHDDQRAHQDLRENGVVYGSIKSAFDDRQMETSGDLKDVDSEDIKAHMAEIHDRMEWGENTIQQSSDEGRIWVQEQKEDAADPLHKEQRSFILNSLRQEADEEKSPAAWTYDTFGAPMLWAAGQLNELGLPLAKAFMTAYQDALDRGEARSTGLRIAIHQVPMFADDLMNRMIESEAQKTKDALTPEQNDFIKETLKARMAVLFENPKVVSTNKMESRERLFAVSGEAGPPIASILEKIAGQERPDLIGLIRQWNRTGAVSSK